MANKEKKWFGITRSPEEDLALVDIMMSTHAITSMRIVAILLMSVVILAVYLTMNLAFFPAYHVVTPFAEDNEVFTEHYPPFRMHEWVNYSMSRELLDGGLFEEDSFSRGNSVGFSVLAAPFVAKWGERGIFLANAFIVWAAALMFFFLMLEFVEYQLAVALTLILALATPNIFYASSAFAETAAQLILLFSVWAFVKGMLSQRELLFYLMSGLAAGLLIFFVPSLTLIIVLYVSLLLIDRGRFSFSDRNVLGMIGGFSAMILLFFVIGKVSTGSFSGLLGPATECLYDLTKATSHRHGRNLFAGLWAILFDSPQGFVFIMPVITLVPFGLITMWRNELHSITYIVSFILLYQLLLVAFASCPITGESVGARQLVPVIPFMVMPLAFIWREQTGERIWLVAALVLTVYMSTFGWWTGKEHGRGFFIGVLQDREARMIIQARKGLLEPAEFRSSSELSSQYIESLKTRDIAQWLKIIDSATLKGIEGVERHVFTHLCNLYDTGETSNSSLIESVDPNGGVVPRLPALQNRAFDFSE